LSNRQTIGIARQNIRWGILGASTIARERVIGAIRSAGGIVSSVYSSDAARAAAFAAAEGVAHHTTEFDAHFERVDAVYVSGINSLHHQHVLLAAAAGKHVLCEKPLAVDLVEADAMIDACATAGVILGVNHHLRGSIIHRTIRAMIGEGRVGRPLFARVINAGLLPAELKRWRLSPAAGGGVVLDKATHDLDLLRYLLTDEPLTVTAMADRSVVDGQAVDQSVMSVLRFSSGLLAQTHDAFNLPLGRTELHVQGTGGYLIATDCLSGRPAGTLDVTTPRGHETVALAHVDPYGQVVSAFHDAIAGRGQPLATGEDGRAAIAAALAMLRSIEGEETVTIPMRVQP
jgi:1,5-anhydro-D-fructose reductase (1,5-anhydro-D-mannitol-forming)